MQISLGQLNTNAVSIAIVMVGLVFLLAMFFIAFGFGNLYMVALFSGARVSFTDLIGMKLRRVDARIIVYSRIRAAKAGIAIPLGDLEAHHVAGGRVRMVVDSLIVAKAAKIALSWKDATTIDLAGRDVLAEVQSAARQKATRPNAQNWTVLDERPEPGTTDQ